MANVFVAESKIHGVGVFAARHFAPDEIILEMDDSRVVDDEHPLRPELGEFGHHCDYLEGGKVILQAFPERYINSSCDPNVYVRRSGGESLLMARRSITAGEELTHDYIIDEGGGEVWECSCGSPRCRGTVVASFFQLPLELQLEYLPLLNEWFISEHQAEVDALRERQDA